MTPLPEDVVSRFQELMQRARQTSLKEPAAMTLATADANGRVAARIVLLQQFDERGFVFFTNTNSDKAKQIEHNTRVALCFHWDELVEQVRIEGSALRVNDTDADLYWNSRPRESQIGAWASRQSETLDARSTLEGRVLKYEAEFRNSEVPRPDFWSGYRIAVDRIEFWSGRFARLHERSVHELVDGDWTQRNLFP